MAVEIKNSAPITSVPDQSKLIPTNFSYLPKYSLELFRNNLAKYDVDEGYLNSINVWWRTVDKTGAWVKRAEAALATPALPRPEMTDVTTAIKGATPAFEAVNVSLNNLLTAEAQKNNPIVGLAKEIFNTQARKKQIVNISDLITNFKSGFWSDSTDQVVAFCEAFGETSALNDPKTMRLKIAQWSFEELITLFPRLKMSYQSKGVDTPTTIDQIDIEKDELIEALKSDPWTPEETEKWQKIYEDNRKTMGKFHFEDSVKDSFDFLFRCTQGKVSPENSAIKILHTAQKILEGIADDDTLQDSWDYESEEAESKK